MTTTDLRIRLVATRGLPASGKTTWAKQWMGEGPRRTRSNRDDLRDMMFGGWTGDPDHEDAVTVAQHTTIAELLAAGWSVVVDDTNLRPGVLDKLRETARWGGAEFVIHDLTGVPVGECIARDERRRDAGQRSVGAAVIRDMCERYLAGAS